MPTQALCFCLSSRLMVPLLSFVLYLKSNSCLLSPGFLWDGCPSGESEPLPHWLLCHVVDILYSHTGYSRFAFLEEVADKSLLIMVIWMYTQYFLLNLLPHFHQSVSNHSSPEAPQKCSEALAVSALHQHSHLLCCRWVTAAEGWKIK